MRIGTSLSYLLPDHLGSPAVTVNAATNAVTRTGYKPWGEERYGAAPSTFSYTGQRDEPDLGIMYYGARWYDPYLNRFLSPDDIVLDPYNSLDWDRYAYARNNPVRYNDPSGHAVADDTRGGCGLPSCIINPPTKQSSSSSDNTDPGTQTIITLDTISLVISGIEAVAADGIGGAIMGIGCLGAGLETMGLSCAISFKMALAVDVYMSSTGPLGLGAIENGLGYLSLGLTVLSDKDNSWSFDENGSVTSVTIGKDTVIATRNTLIGTIPESNIDFAVSASQLKYDYDRLNGIKSGGPIIIGKSGGMTLADAQKFVQTLFTDWW